MDGNEQRGEEQRGTFLKTLAQRVSRDDSAFVLIIATIWVVSLPHLNDFSSLVQVLIFLGLVAMTVFLVLMMRERARERRTLPSTHAGRRVLERIEPSEVSPEEYVRELQRIEENDAGEGG